MKIDKFDKIWFLFSNSIRLADENPNSKLNNNPLNIGNNLTKPDFVKLQFTVNSMIPACLIKANQCVNCDKSC